METINVGEVCSKTKQTTHSSGYQPMETTVDEVIAPDSNEAIDYRCSESEDNEWPKLTPHSSPESSSGYQSTETSGDEAIDSGVKDKTEDTSQEERDTFDNDWNYEDFDPENPYLYEPLTYASRQGIFLAPELCKSLYNPAAHLPQRIPRKQVSRSPEIKPKISRRTGLPRRSSQFLRPDSPSEGSESD